MVNVSSFKVKKGYSGFSCAWKNGKFKIVKLLLDLAKDLPSASGFHHIYTGMLNTMTQPVKHIQVTGKTNTQEPTVTFTFSEYERVFTIRQSEYEELMCGALEGAKEVFDKVVEAYKRNPNEKGAQYLHYTVGILPKLHKIVNEYQSLLKTYQDSLQKSVSATNYLFKQFKKTSLDLCFMIVEKGYLDRSLVRIEEVKEASKNKAKNNIKSKAVN